MAYPPTAAYAPHAEPAVGTVLGRLAARRGTAASAVNGTTGRAGEHGRLAQRSRARSIPAGAPIPLPRANTAPPKATHVGRTQDQNSLYRRPDGHSLPLARCQVSVSSQQPLSAFPRR